MTSNNAQRPKEFKPSWTCPNCNEAKFDSQRKMIEHALPCKRGELDR